MATQGPQPETGTALKAYEDKIVAEIREASARLERFEAKAKEKRVQAEITAVNALKTARLEIERKLQDLKTMQGEHLTRSKADIDAAAAALKRSLDELGRKLTT